MLAENNKTITVESSDSTVIEVDGDNTDNTGDGINIQNGAVSITSQGSNTIHANSAHGDGIILHGDNTDVSVALIAQNGNNTIESGNNGVDNYGAQTVTIKAENGLNKITTTEKEDTEGKEQTGDGLRIDERSSGSIYLTAKGNIINAEDAGLNNSSANNDSQMTLTATDGGNFIYGQKEAVLLGGLGKISVTSGIDSEDGSQEISLLAEVGEDGPYKGFNNALIGGENGIHASANSDGIFEANAKNNNYISGSVNGIWTETSEGSGPTINITATNDNIIGFTDTITDDEGTEHQGQFGQKGIYVGSGTVTLQAGNNNKITTTTTGSMGEDGILVSKGGSVTLIAGNQNIISSGWYGINSSGETYLKATNDNFITSIADSAIQIGEIGTDSGLVVIEAEQGKNSITGGTVGVLVNTARENKIIAAGNNEISGGDLEQHIGSGINSINGYLYVNSSDGSNIIKGGFTGISVDQSSEITIEANNGINQIYGYGGNSIYGNNLSSVSLTADANNIFGANGIFDQNGAVVKLVANHNDNYISASNYGIVSQSKSEVYLTALEGGNRVLSAGYGIYSQSDSEVSMLGKTNTVEASSNGLYASTRGYIYLAAQGNNTVRADQRGIYSYGSSIDLQAGDSNEIYAGAYGVLSYDSFVSINAQKLNNIYGSSYGIYGLTYRPDIYSSNTIVLTGENNSISSDNIGVVADSSKGLYSDGSGTLVELNASVDNTIRGGEIYTVDGVDFAKNYAIQSLNGSSVTLEAGNQNSLFGAVYAEGAGATVTLNADTNYVASYAQSSTLGDLNTDDAFKDKSVISALYAEEGANISLTGNSNILRTYAEYDNEYQLERVVWAYNGKVGEEKAKGTSISINGYSYIATDSYEKSPNSLDIAIAAGTAVGLNEDDVNTPINLEDRAKVELTYADSVNEDGSTRHSFISGDILSAYDGLVDIKPKDASNAGINIEGNLLAGNNGIVNVDLGNGGTLTGRADDYGDSGVESLNGGHQNMTFFDPAFSSAIYKGGEVNLTMGEGSRWNVTGQSWITRINTENLLNITKKI